MTQADQLLVNYGLWIVFGAVFLEQVGIPFPAPLLMLAAGALAAAGKFNLLGGMMMTLVACLLADGIWFFLGRYRGNHVLGFLCRMSLEPDSCIRRTQNVFSKYGAKGIVVAKFVPGFSTVAPPLAGMSGMRLSSFLVADGAGSLLYGICFFGLGFLFSNQIEQINSAISHIGGSALALILGNDVPFTLSSPGLPGVTIDYPNFSAAAAEVGPARIWGGLHFRNSCVVGGAMGVQIGDQAVANFLRPLE